MHTKKVYLPSLFHVDKSFSHAFKDSFIPLSSADKIEGLFQNNLSCLNVFKTYSKHQYHDNASTCFAQA